MLATFHALFRQSVVMRGDGTRKLTTIAEMAQRSEDDNGNDDGDGGDNGDEGAAIRSKAERQFPVAVALALALARSNRDTGLAPARVSN